jgi:hypothetical protein
VRRLTEVYEVRRLLLNAELDAAEKQSDRITLYQNFVNGMKEYEKMVAQRVETARAPRSSFLKVKAIRLEAEIHLERAKMKNP